MNIKRNLKLMGVVILSIASLNACSPSSNNDIKSSTVMVVRSSGFGGGTGVVVSTSETESLVLTNVHVCEAIKSGGIVRTTDNQNHLVTSFKESLVHDVCLIKVSTKLKSHVTVASLSPNMYDMAVVSGHPNLLPNVITRGHFSDRAIIDVMIGMKECTDEDRSNPVLGFVCAFLGKLPIIKKYESILVTATIMAGSSGSGVYNSNNELSGLVFAGGGGLSYAFIVPHEYIVNFLHNEVSKVTEVFPNYTLDLGKQNSESDRALVDKCAKPNAKLIQDMCKIISRDLNWRFPN